ncbi:MAG: alpha/beta hydrolase [Leptospirillia bacterium]
MRSEKLARQEHIAGLSVTLAGGVDGNGGGDGPLVVLLHGYGAPGTDLVPLAHAVAAPAGTRFAFPAAPHSLGPAMFGDSRAWWHIDWNARQTQIERDGMMDLSGETPEGMEEARHQVTSLLDTLETRLGVTPERTVIGGFSQGAMLACDIVLHDPRPFSGAVFMSPTLLAEQEWSARAPKRAGLPVLMSHGRTDPVLPFPMSVRLCDLLTGAGLAIHFVPFHGGHEIPSEVTGALGDFLGNRFGGGGDGT